MEQRSRKPLRGQLAYDDLPAIPTPRRELDLPQHDDEIDTDTDTPAAVEDKVADKLQDKKVVEDGLSEREKAILAFERQAWRHAGAKEQAIRDRFDLSATRYYQLLNAMLDKPAALAHDPVLVGRLRRLRGSRARARGR